jgi:hypothetical protein
MQQRMKKRNGKVKLMRENAKIAEGNPGRTNGMEEEELKKFGWIENEEKLMS